MENPILELRACHVNVHGVESQTMARSGELPHVDFYALYAKKPDGTDEHLCDFHPDYSHEGMLEAMEKNADALFLMGAVYAMAMMENGSSVENILGSMGTKEEELAFVAPEDLAVIKDDILRTFPNVDQKIFTS